MSTTARRHIPELDGLRAVAVIAVILFHCAPYGPVRGGFLGVDLFFVLSGFLITGVLHDEYRRYGRIDLKTFYARRMARLAPALLLLLAVYLMIAPWVWPGHDHLVDAVLTAAYVSDYTYTFDRLPIYLRHSWSLSVEEQFYLLWPLVLPLVLRGRRALIWLMIAYIAVLAWRFSFIGDWRSYYYRFDTRATGLIAGIILHFTLPKLALRPAHAYLATALFVLLAMSAQINMAKLFIPFVELAAAILIGCAATGNTGFLARGLGSGVAVIGGRLSYAVYLWHFPFAYWARDRWSFAPTVVATIVFAVTMAAISYVTVEAIGRRLSRRLRASSAIGMPSECGIKRSSGVQGRADQKVAALAER